MTLGSSDDATLTEQGLRGQFQSGDLLARRYHIVRPLGTGGMGSVYEVIDRELEEEVALKLLHQELSIDPDYRQRLRQEVRLARRVSHPNVCRVHDLGQHGDQLFVTMELVRGPTLRQVLRDLASGSRDPLSFGRKIDMIVQLAAALAAAHRVGIVHRDVKPDNVIVEDDRCVLTDFGVASPVEVAGDRRIVVGTPAYMAPEVLRGSPATPLADVYACALVAYELLAGATPYRVQTLRDAINLAREHEPIPPLPEFAVPELGRDAMDRVMARALSFAPEDRYGAVDKFAEAMALAARGAGDEPAMPARPPTARAPAPRAAPPNQDTVIEGDEVDSALPRVATVLYMRYGGLEGSDPAADLTTGDTRPIDIGDLEDLERVVTDLGGTVISSAPGELLALFGAPRSLGDDEVRAARAGHALVERCTGARATLHTGRIKVGRGSRASGEALTRARELIDFAEDGQLLASAVTTRHLFGRFSLFKVPTSGGAHWVQPGLLANADLYDLPPLVGREREVNQLERLVLDAFGERSPRTALVIGPAGAGKSRLRLELQRHISERREIEWLDARATPLGEAVPLGLLRSAAREWFDAAEHAAPGGRAAAFAAARQWLEARASRTPVVVAFDDVQWADGASLEFIALLRRTLEHVPVALVLFARTDTDVPQLGVDVDLTVSLAPLGDEASRAIARRFAPDAPDEVLDELVRQAGGSPFFLEELSMHLAESGDQDGARELPAAVELVIQARLDRMPRPARRVVHAASVVGREFDRSALRAALEATPISDDVLDRALADLERRQIIAPMAAARGAGPHATPTTGQGLGEGERYWFRHALIRDVAYAQLGESKRRRIHAAVASNLEQRGAVVRREPALLVALAQHRDAAGDKEGACRAFRAAGELALHLAAYQEAYDALTRAEALADGADAQLQELLGDALIHLDSTAAVDRFQRGFDSARTVLAQARLCHKLGTAYSNLARNEEAARTFEQGLALIGPIDSLARDNRELRVIAARLIGTLGWLLGYEMGDHRRGLAFAEKAVFILEGDDNPRELANALSRLAANYLRAGRWHDRLRCNKRNLELAEQLGDLDQQLIAHVNLGVNYHSLGQLDTALAHTRRALDLSVRTGRITTRALTHNNLGIILFDAGQLAPARAHLQEALVHAGRIGYKRFLPETHSVLGLLALKDGHLHAAERALHTSLRLAREARSAISEGIALRLLAGVASLDGGRQGEIEELLASAHELLADDRYERARTWAVEAKIARRVGDEQKADALTNKAASEFEALGASLDRARLDDLDDLR